MKPLVLFGDSHISVYRRAAMKLESTKVTGRALGGAMQFYDNSYDFGPDGISTNNARCQLMLNSFYKLAEVSDIRACGKRLVVSMGTAAAPFHGNRNWKDMDFGDAPDARKAYVSAGLLDAMVADAQADVIRLYEYLFSHDLVCAVVLGPRPQRRHKTVKWLGEAKLLQLIERFEAPVRTYLQSKDVPVMTPAGTEDAQGFLREEFWGADWSHANDEYGQRVVKMIEPLAA